MVERINQVRSMIIYSIFFVMLKSMNSQDFYHMDTVQEVSPYLEVDCTGRTCICREFHKCVSVLHFPLKTMIMSRSAIIQ
jgi:hypothetical protein